MGMWISVWRSGHVLGVWVVWMECISNVCWEEGVHVNGRVEVYVVGESRRASWKS